MEPHIEQPLEYQSVSSASHWSDNKRMRACTYSVAGIVAVVNIGLVSYAIRDRSWVAMNIMILSGPITNLVLALLSLALIPAVRDGYFIVPGAVEPPPCACFACPFPKTPPIHRQCRQKTRDLHYDIVEDTLKIATALFQR
jgi:hypothetical protein